LTPVKAAASMRRIPGERTMKSVLAVLAGLVVTIVLSTCIDPCAWIGGRLMKGGHGA
jgi:hypothetical protein